MLKDLTKQTLLDQYQIRVFFRVEECLSNQSGRITVFGVGLLGTSMHALPLGISDHGICRPEIFVQDSVFFYPLSISRLFLFVFIFDVKLYSI